MFNPAKKRQRFGRPAGQQHRTAVGWCNGRRLQDFARFPGRWLRSRAGLRCGFFHMGCRKAALSRQMTGTKESESQKNRDQYGLNTAHAWQIYSSPQCYPSAYSAAGAATFENVTILSFNWSDSTNPSRRRIIRWACRAMSCSWVTRMTVLPALWICSNSDMIS